MGANMFQWDRNNPREIRAHRIKPEEAEQALENDPILVYEHQVEDELRFVYYGKTAKDRLLALSRDGTRRQDSGDHRV